MGTHFSSGVTNVSANDAMAILRQPDPSQYYNQNDDFFNYTAAQWIVTDTGTGTTAIVDGAGGQLQIANAAAGATDARQMQWAGSSAAARLTVYWDTTKDLVIKSRFKASHATNSAFVIGAATVDTTVVASLPTDGLYFYKASGAASLIASTRKAGTSSNITLGNIVADTFVDVALNYSATAGQWSGWLNNTPVGYINSTTNTPTNGLCVSIGLLNATAVAHTLTVDYLNIMVQR